MSGNWDVLFLFLGLSGFFLAVLPGIIAIFYAKAVGDLAFQRSGTESAPYATIWAKWSIGVLIYYATVTIGLVLAMIARRRKWIVYNVDLNILQTVIVEIARRRGWNVAQVGKLLVLERYVAAVQDGFVGGPDIIFYMERMESLHHATITWTTEDETLRNEIGSEIDAQLGRAGVPDNLFGTWMLWIGVGLFEVFWFFGCILMRALLL